MSKHTPGPWVFGRMPDDSVKMILGGADRRYVATVKIHQSPRHMGAEAEAEREANARLIAASPELLEATRWLRSALINSLLGKKVRDADEAISYAEKVISKATGDV